MQMLSIDAAKTRQEKLNKKRNLFGLGLTSLIAACGDKAAGGSGNISDVDDGDNIDDGDDIDDDTPKGVDLPNEIVKAAELSGTAEGKSGFIATPGGDTSSFAVAVTDGTTSANLTFNDGNAYHTNAAKIYTLTTTGTQYDLVVSSGTVDSSKGAIFIFWDVVGIEDETIGGTSTTATNQRLEIKGAADNNIVGAFAPEFLQIGGTVNNYDMVFAGAGVDRVSGGEGAIYILWDISDYAEATKTIDLASITDATSGSLTIYGGKPSDYIGTYIPQWLELGGADNSYDIVIRPESLHKMGVRKGAIYVLWDVTDYYDTEVLHKTVTLDNSLDSSLGNSLVESSDAYTNGATYGLLAIYGAKTEDQIGTFAPEFLQIGGVAGDKLDIVIRSHNIDRDVDGRDDLVKAGAIYILWDVADYAGKNKTIDLGKLDEADTTALGEGATAGSLAIYGAQTNDGIGIHAPEFLQIGGVAGDKLDVIVRSQGVDKPNSNNVHLGEGAIYILWDVADYAGKNKTIDLSKLDEADTTALGEGATAGSLTIYGAKKYDLIGNNAPEFLQIAGKDDNYDMVIRSEEVDKSGTRGVSNDGAIYVLWDVADYYSADAADANKIIDFAAPADASSGLLTIYGREAGANLGSDSNNILYNADGELINIDGDAAETKDIALTDGKYTYIFFGDKVTNDANNDDKVDSKTIDLGAIEDAFADEATPNAGFFSYDFDAQEVALSSIGAESRAGYRFADDTYKTLQDIQAAASAAIPLSDTDSDLGVWDIA